MAKKEKKLETMENVEVNGVENGVETLEQIVEKDCVIVEGNTYNNYKPEEEELVQKGLEVLKPMMSESKELMIAFCYAKFWNDRKTFLKVRNIARLEAEKRGMDVHQYEQEVVRPEYDRFAGILRAITQMNYAFNYLKPREGYTPKDKQIAIRINGDIYYVGKKTLETLKEQYGSDKELLKSKLLEVASTENKSKIEEF